MYVRQPVLPGHSAAFSWFEAHGVGGLCQSHDNRPAGGVNRSGWRLVLGALAAWALQSSAWAQAQHRPAQPLAPVQTVGAAPAGCDTLSALARSSTLNLRIDNDMFGGRGQDQGYSNGFLLSWVSPNLLSYADNLCLPPTAQKINRRLKFLQPQLLDEQNMTLGLAQMMYTPTNRERQDLIANDRPYAGALLLSVGYNARQGDELRTTQLRVGVVGPLAKAGEVQGWWHDIIGVGRFHGWKNQLHNEPVLQLLHERNRRLLRQESRSGWGWDFIGHWGASVGNFATYANAGGELRLGRHLPDDFGTAPLRPAGENTAPLKKPRVAGWSGHLFAAVDGRWVLHDITLDGNSFRSSHSVHKRAWVADVGYGLAVYHGQWRLAIARYHRTREFRGQQEVPVYGTVTLSRRF